MLLEESVGAGSSSKIVPFLDSKKAKTHTMNKFKTNTTVALPCSNNSKSRLELNQNTDTDEENYRAMLNDNTRSKNMRELNTSSTVSRQGHPSKNDRK